MCLFVCGVLCVVCVVLFSVCFVVCVVYFVFCLRFCLAMSSDIVFSCVIVFSIVCHCIAMSMWPR